MQRIPSSGRAGRAEPVARTGETGASGSFVVVQTPQTAGREGERIVLLRSLSCTRCEYNLRGLPLDGVCPECALAIGDSVMDTVDPAARRLPRLRNPRKVGDALVWLMVCLVVAAALLLARPVAFRIELLGVGGGVWYWAPPWLTLVAAAVLLSGLWSVRALFPPAGEEVVGSVRRSLWLLSLGLTIGAVAAFVAWLTGWNLRPAPKLSLDDVQRAVVDLALVGATIITMLALRGVLRLIGERSREYRTSSGGRQRTVDMTVAAAVIGLGVIARVVAAVLERPALETVGTIVVWISTLMLVIGLLYLLANAWWIRRSLRRPPPALAELVGPESRLERTSPDAEGPEAAGDAGDAG